MCQTMINNVSKNIIVLLVVLVTGFCAVMAIVNMLIKARILIDRYCFTLVMEYDLKCENSCFLSTKIFIRIFFSYLKQIVRFPPLNSQFHIFVRVLKNLTTKVF